VTYRGVNVNRAWGRKRVPFCVMLTKQYNLVTMF
jgi:hypothetical protein